MTKKIVFIFLFFTFLTVEIQNLFAFDKSVQKELVIAASTSNYFLDPYHSDTSTDASILVNLYEGLFTYNPYTLEPEPGLIESFKIARDKKTWTFTLKNNLCYSDGSAITASEIKRSWLTALDPKVQSAFGSLLDIIEGAEEYRLGKASTKNVAITIKDEKTLVVKLKTPAEHFSKILCHFNFAAIPEKSGVYSGAYVLTQNTDEKIILTKNEFFYDAKNVAIPSVKYELCDDASQNTFNFNLGTTNWISGDFDYLNIYDPSTVYLNAGFSTYYFFFKCQKAPWNNAEIRKALLYATPWEELRDTAQIPANTLVLPINDYPEIEGLWETDIEYAKSLLSQNLTQNQIKNTTLDICIMQSQESLAKILQAAWQELGLTVNIHSIQSYLYFDLVDSSDYDVYMYNWIADFSDPIAMLELFRKGSSLNVTTWESSEYEQALNEAAINSNSEKRADFLANAEEILLNESVIIPVEHGVMINCVDTTILKGWFPNPLDIHPIRFMYFEREPFINGVV